MTLPSEEKPYRTQQEQAPALRDDAYRQVPGRTVPQYYESPHIFVRAF